MTQKLKWSGLELSWGPRYCTSALLASLARVGQNRLTARVFFGLTSEVPLFGQHFLSLCIFFSLEESHGQRSRPIMNDL
jgi:hypothetical protein